MRNKLDLVLLPVTPEHTILASARIPKEPISSLVRSATYNANSQTLINGFPATAPGISIATSTDRTAWSHKGVVWPNGASWTDEYTLQSNAYVYTFLLDDSFLDPYHATVTFGLQSAITMVPSFGYVSESMNDVVRMLH